MKITIRKKDNPLAKAFRESLNSVEAEVEIRKLMIVEELLQFMKRHDMKRTELAERMGVSPSRITAMLSGDGNLTIDTLVRAGRAVGADLQQTFVPQGHKARWIHYPCSSKNASSVAYEADSVTQVTKAPTPQLYHIKPAQNDAEDAA